jgi:hypothetical protein
MRKERKKRGKEPEREGGEGGVREQEKETREREGGGGGGKAARSCRVRTSAFSTVEVVLPTPLACSSKWLCSVASYRAPADDHNLDPRA